MGHCIMHNTYPASWTLKQVTDDVVGYVRHSGDRYGTDSVRMPTDKVFDTSDEAEAYIEKVDRHDYDGIAVKYLDFTGVEGKKNDIIALILDIPQAALLGKVHTEIADGFGVA